MNRYEYEWDFMNQRIKPPAGDVTNKQSTKNNKNIRSSKKPIKMIVILKIIVIII